MRESSTTDSGVESLREGPSGCCETEFDGRLGRRDFLENVGKVSLAGFAVAGPIASVRTERPAPRLDPEAPLRIGMIGREGHVDYVLEELGSVKGARIAAYAFEDGDWAYNSDGTRRSGAYDMDPNRRWVESRPWSKSAPHLYETYQEMLDKESLDLVVVCLPYARNAFAITAAARAGLNVLSEKPVAVTLPDLEIVETAVQQSGVRLSAMFAMRYFPNIYTMWKAVGDGAVGRPILARAQKSYKWGAERPWFYHHREIYGSTILWVGIHAIDYLRWVTGLEVRRVSGFHSNLAHTKYAGVQDNAVIGLELDGGATGAVTMDFLRPETAPTHGDDRLRIAGSTGVLETMDPDGSVSLLSDQGPPRQLVRLDPPASLFADFVAELRGQGRHLIGPDEAARVTRICIVATQAADAGQVLSV
ncbi:MAG: Gfo/Idh/MocA family oxidoreductase [Acidobacteriota bacterium]